MRSSSFAFSVLVLSLATSVTFAQKEDPQFRDRKVRAFIGSAPRQNTLNAQMICTMSTFFSIDSNEQTNETMHIEGRGLATCKNDQGFTSDVPVSAELEVKAMGRLANAGELSFSGNSSSFVIPREASQIQDSYVVKTFASDFSDKSQPSILFGGVSHDLMIEMKFSSSTDSFRRLQIQNMTIRIDETAPTLD